MKNSEKRRMLIYEEIKREKSSSIRELAKLFQVSSETIRNDLDILEKQGKIEKKHGFALLTDKYAHIPLRIKREDHIEDKIVIASKAASLVEDHFTIWLDAGSSAYTLLRFLSQKKDLTIATNSIEIATALATSKHKLIVIGGMLEPVGQSMVGPFANEQIASLHFDVAFLGSDGFENSSGPTTFAYEEIQIKYTALKQAERSVLLVDRSKIHDCAPYQYADFSELDYIITTIETTYFPDPKKVMHV